MADPRTIKLDYSVFEKIDTIIFDEIHSDKVRLVDTGTGKYLELRYQGFHQMGIWTPKAGAPFVCIEPWNGTPTPTGFTCGRSGCGCWRRGRRKAIR